MTVIVICGIQAPRVRSSSSCVCVCAPSLLLGGKCGAIARDKELCGKQCATTRQRAIWAIPHPNSMALRASLCGRNDACDEHVTGFTTLAEAARVVPSLRCAAEIEGLRATRPRQCAAPIVRVGHGMATATMLGYMGFVAADAGFSPRYLNSRKVHNSRQNV